MAGWHANKEFVSARAECQLVKDGVRSWEAVRLPINQMSGFFFFFLSSLREEHVRPCALSLAALSGRRTVGGWGGKGSLLPRKVANLSPWLLLPGLSVELHGPALPLLPPPLSTRLPPCAAFSAGSCRCCSSSSRQRWPLDQTSMMSVGPNSIFFFREMLFFFEGLVA